WPGRYEVVRPVLKVMDGRLPVPDDPGLGVDIIEGEIVRYPGIRNVAELPPDDGWANEPGTRDEALYIQTRLSRRRKLRRR
ncbi:MAG: hypothetical protein R3D03_24485, partial [Geminicoccaceae bacterium]